MLPFLHACSKHAVCSKANNHVKPLLLNGLKNHSLVGGGRRAFLITTGLFSNDASTPYDTHKLHKALIQSGFSESQAEVLNEQLRSVVKNNTTTYDARLSQLDALTEELNKKVAKIDLLEKELALLEKGTVHVLRVENQKLAADIKAFNGLLKDDLQKIRNDLQLDFNLHKSWTKSALTELDKEVSRLSNHIEIKAADLGAQLDRGKMESLKYQIGLIFSCIGVLVSVLFAIWRFTSK